MCFLLQRAEAEKQAAREAIKAEETKQEMIRSRQVRRIMVTAIVSIASVLLSIILYSSRGSMPLVRVIQIFPLRYILVFIIPCLCLFTAFVGKRNASIIKPALIICAVLFAVQVVSIIIYLVGFDGRISKELFRLAYQLERYIYGIDLGVHLRNTIRLLGKAPVRIIGQQFALIAPGFFAVFPNILCTTVLAIYSKKMK